MNGQTETVASLSIAGTGISSGGVLINNNGSTTSTLTGAVTMAADSSVGGSANVTLASALGGAHVLTKIGGGTLKLNASDSYSSTTVSAGTLEGGVGGSIKGNTTVNAGTLKLDSTTAMDSSATLTLASSPSAGAVNLNFSGTQNISAMNWGATSMAQGTWGASGAA